MEFTFSKRARTISMALMLLGFGLALVGVFNDHTDHHQHSWAAFFLNGLFFFGISLGVLFFYGLQYAVEAAWSVMLRRVFEGMFKFIPIGAVVLLVVFLAGSFGWHHIWHWMDSRLYDINDPLHYDKIIAGKAFYLNLPFFWIRAIAFLATFVIAARWYRKNSLAMDEMTGDTLIARHKKMYRQSATFLVLFAVFSSVLAWDWLMSIDAHWFSTLYGWYVFAGMWNTGMTTALIITIYLRSKGLLPQVNNSHIHDMGKWVFATSFLWTYLYFSQFMLYWYSNVPEEGIYFYQRIQTIPGIMWGMFFINFAVPMLVLMSRDAKRNPRYLIGVGVVILIGHWLDMCQMVLPGTLGSHFHGIGILEIGFALGFVGLYMFVVLTELTKAPLTIVNSPYLEESVHHSI